MQCTVDSIGMVVDEVVRAVIDKKTNILALHGDLGAGKTTFVAALARALGVAEAIISPTFIVYRMYNVHHVPAGTRWEHLVHIDAYRLEGAEDARAIRLEELFADSKNFVCIEWPEHIGVALPAHAFHIYLTYTGVHERDITWA